MCLLSFRSVACCILVALLPITAHAHVGIVSPPPRGSTSGSTGPCSSVGRAENPTHFQRGETVLLQWVETINHNATYRVALASSEDELAALTLADTTTVGGIIIANGIPDEVDKKYELEFRLPDEDCKACTLQVAQVLGTAAYYQCADITIGDEVEGAGGLGGAFGGGGQGTVLGLDSAGGQDATGGDSTQLGTAVGGSDTLSFADPEDDALGGCWFASTPSQGPWGTLASFALIAGGCALRRRRRHDPVPP